MIFKIASKYHMKNSKIHILKYMIENMIPDFGTFQDSCLQMKFQSLPRGSPTCYAKFVFHLLDIKRRKESSYFPKVEPIAGFKSVKTFLMIEFFQEELV